MSTFLKAKLKISDNKTNIDKYRVAANVIILYQNHFSNNHHSKIHDDKAIILCQNSSCLKWTYGLFYHNYKIAT